MSTDGVRGRESAFVAVYSPVELKHFAVTQGRVARLRSYEGVKFELFGLWSCDGKRPAGDQLGAAVATSVNRKCANAVRISLRAER